MHKIILYLEQKITRKLSHVSMCWLGNGYFSAPVGCCRQTTNLQISAKPSKKVISIPLWRGFLKRSKAVVSSAPNPILLTSRSEIIAILNLHQSGRQNHFYPGKKIRISQSHSKKLFDKPKSSKQFLHLFKCSTIFSSFCISLMQCRRNLPI